MKKFIFFIIGAVLGFAACFGLFYASGLVLESQGLLLYASEADQQRNFNIFIACGLVFSAIGGWLFVRKFK